VYYTRQGQFLLVSGGLNPQKTALKSPLEGGFLQEFHLLELLRPWVLPGATLLREVHPRQPRWDV
jgi:hypothetical protein